MSDLQQECIVDNPSDARVGVSRPTIKKVRLGFWLGTFCPTSALQFVEHKYHIDLNSLTASQLNRAITSGSEKGIFLLPKGPLSPTSHTSFSTHSLSGPSGKVKLASKPTNEVSRSLTTLINNQSDLAFQNTEPALKKSASQVVATKAKASTAKTLARKSVARATTRALPKTKALTSTKKFASAPKKALVKKPAATTKKATVPKKSAPTKKRTTAKRGAAKKVTSFYTGLTV